MTVNNPEKRSSELSSSILSSSSITGIPVSMMFNGELSDSIAVEGSNMGPDSGSTISTGGVSDSMAGEGSNMGPDSASYPT